VQPANTALGVAGKALAAGTAGTAAIATQVAHLSSALGQLHEGAGGLQTGITKLQKGNTDLTKGLGQLNGGGKDLCSGLGQLTTGAGSLEAGLGQLSTGAGTLATGLQGAVGPTGELAAGLDTMHKGVGKFSGSLPSPKDLERLQASFPGLFHSGYFVLAAISGAPAAERNVASFALNIGRGGKRRPDCRHLQDRGRHGGDARALPRPAGDDGGVCEQGPRRRRRRRAGRRLTGYRAETSSRIAPAIAGVALAVPLLLMFMLRSILIPLVATASVLLATASTFGL
jgi:X-X-X-Leu-X-X-Gly heptad repeat protein